MRDHLVAFFETHQRLIEADALRLLLSSPEPLLLSRQVLDATHDDRPFVTREIVEEVLAHRSPISGGWAPAAPRSEAVDAGSSPLDVARAPPTYSLIGEGFLTTAHRRDALSEYSELFRSRYRALARMIRGRAELPQPRSVREIAGTEGTTSVVGLVREIRRTPQKGHTIVTLEDETGAVEVLVPKEGAAGRTPLVSDEVIGVRLKMNRDRRRLPLVEHLERPDVPSRRSGRRADGPNHVLFLSDLHVGSKSFLADDWGRLVGFLRGEGSGAALAAAIDHVVVAGDLVDGIGIYPNQDRDLAVHDIVEQYTELGRRLRELPERLSIVVLPGNHDAVCPSEPQPAIPPALAARLPANVRSVGNPSTFALNGVVVQAYHGRSFDDLIPAIPGATYARPTDVMKLMLQMRHLGPIYGGRTPMTPQGRDGLLVDPTPDILVTGHAHTFGVDSYRGVRLLNASAWQAETEYQRMRNITAVPGRGAAVDLSTLAVTEIDCTGSTVRIAPVAG
ncbi:MAG TPA: metallophosphoesterase [Thermoplasmata archaeon]|nr:metallophosphoesterase [Thermoplasmata archaeon]